MKIVLTLLVTLMAISSCHADSTFSLASTMDPGSSASESAFTGETFIISNGDGTVANGKSGDDDSNPAFGGAINLFPREENFEIGTLGFDASQVSLSGTSTTAITSFDLSQFWSADPNRVSSDPNSDATVLSDVSDYAIGLWLFGTPGSITFGTLDASDTVTFTDGVLTSIDLELDTQFNLGGSDPWDGTLSIAGNDLSYQIDDIETSNGVDTNITFNLTGTVSSVGVFSIPEPATGSLGFVALLGLLATRRRK